MNTKENTVNLGKRCIDDFVASHDGRIPTEDEVYTMLQQEGLAITPKGATDIRKTALEIEWCDGCQCEHGPAVCHWR